MIIFICAGWQKKSFLLGRASIDNFFLADCTILLGFGFSSLWHVRGLHDGWADVGCVVILVMMLEQRSNHDLCSSSTTFSTSTSLHSVIHNKLQAEVLFLGEGGLFWLDSTLKDGTSWLELKFLAAKLVFMVVETHNVNPVCSVYTWLFVMEVKCIFHVQCQQVGTGFTNISLFPARPSLSSSRLMKSAPCASVQFVLDHTSKGRVQERWV